MLYYFCMKNMKTFKQFKQEALRDPKFKKAYDELGPEFEVISLMIKNRISGELSQAELAKKLGTKQSAISRFESGSYHPTMSFLYKVADALGVRMKVTFEKKK